MRNLIYGINVTLDGCCDHTKMIADEEVHEYWTDVLRDADTLVYGRKTWQLMVPFWPDVAKSQSGPTKSMNDFAQAFDAVDKMVVFSRTIDSTAKDDKTQIVRGNIKDEILKLKQEPGKKILTGGVDIPAQFIQLGLIDEFYFVVQPIVVGEGRRLLDHVSLPEHLQLKLAGSKTFKSGGLAVRYVTK
jgi:dihydrofolate reductase